MDGGRKNDRKDMRNKLGGEMEEYSRKSARRENKVEKKEGKWTDSLEEKINASE